MAVMYENKEICAICGGMCCKKCGCDFGVDNFDNLQIDYLQKKLEEGYISIVSYQNFKKYGNKIVNNPFLYLRARNVNRPIVDLLSMKTTCLLLKENGCQLSFAERPNGGKNLIPRENHLCYPMKDPILIIDEWKNYQQILQRLVKRLTGNTVITQLKIDVENLFYNVFISNFDGVSKIELLDIMGMLPLLEKVYPDEYTKAKNRVDKSQQLIKVRK